MSKTIFSLEGKNAIVTGGGSGIGQAISQLFARQGATVCIVEISGQNAENTLRLIEQEGGNAFALACDVSNQQQVKEVFEQAARQMGGLDVLVNNAGIAHVGNVENTSEADFDRVLAVNVKGVYNCLQAGVGLMKAKGGAILNMASIASVVGLKDRFAYSMSKGAVLTMTYSVAKDYLEAGIRCNCVSPARIHTPFVDGFLAKNYPGQEADMFQKLAKTQPIGRMGTPEEVAALALYLCSDEAAFITGNNYLIDGGFINLNS